MCFSVFFWTHVYIKNKRDDIVRSRDVDATKSLYCSIRRNNSVIFVRSKINIYIYNLYYSIMFKFYVIFVAEIDNTERFDYCVKCFDLTQFNN